jgi:hypothetical protein
MFEDVGFELFFRGVGKFHAGVGKKFYAIVLKRIVRSGDHNSGLKIILANEAGYAGSGDNTGEGHGRTGLREPGGESSSDVRAGFTRVHADQDMRSPVVTPEISGERAANSIESGVVKGRDARDTTDAVGSEEFFGHWEKPVDLKCKFRAAEFLVDDLRKV